MNRDHQPLGLLPLMLTAALLGACGSKAASVQDEPLPADECDGRGEQYAAGEARSSADGAFTATFLDAKPSPPTYGDNDWQLALIDLHGTAVTDATLEVRPWMPDHAHGSNKTTVVTALGGGDYRLSPIFFGMPGYWEVTISVSAQAGNSSLMFSLCVPKN